jgi:hypothetical protein
VLDLETTVRRSARGATTGAVGRGDTHRRAHIGQHFTRAHKFVILLAFFLFCAPLHRPTSRVFVPCGVAVQGSATGAFSAFSSDVVPSFVLMAIKGHKVVTYVYELRDGEVNVSKSEFIKQK